MPSAKYDAELYAFLPRVDFMYVGQPVFYNGLEVATVHAMQIQNNAVLIKLSFDSKTCLPNDIALVADYLKGAQTVDLYFTQGTIPSCIHSGDTILAHRLHTETIFATPLDSLLADSIMQNLQKVLHRMPDILKAVEQKMKSISDSSQTDSTQIPSFKSLHE